MFDVYRDDNLTKVEEFKRRVRNIIQEEDDTYGLEDWKINDHYYELKVVMRDGRPYYYDPLITITENDGIISIDNTYDEYEIEMKDVLSMTVNVVIPYLLCYANDYHMCDEDDIEVVDVTCNDDYESFEFLKLL